MYSSAMGLCTIYSDSEKRRSTNCTFFFLPEHSLEIERGQQYNCKHTINYTVLHYLQLSIMHQAVHVQLGKGSTLLSAMF